MPTIQTEIDRVRTNSKIDDEQYEDSDAIMDFNKLVRELGVFAKENWDTWTANLVNWQNEYKADVLLWTPNVDIVSVEKVYINYWEGEKSAEFKPYGTVDKTSTEYSKSSPVFYVKDNSIFIFPTPEEDVTGGFQWEFTYLLKDYDLTDNVEDIPLPRTLLDVMFRFWFEEFIERTVRNDKGAAKILRDAYKQEMKDAKDMIDSLWPDVVEITNDTNNNFMY